MDTTPATCSGSGDIVNKDNHDNLVQKDCHSTSCDGADSGLGNVKTLGQMASPPTLIKLKQHELDLSKTFQLWPVSAETTLKNSEDAKFLQSMKTDRVATFGGVDTILFKKQH